MKVRFYANDGKPRARAMGETLAAEAAASGLSVTAQGDADIVITLGGDGTLLRAVHEFPSTPVVGFNLGGLGYLASVGEGDFSRALSLLADGRFRIGERSMLEVRLGDRAYPALNDVVLVREMSGHAARIDLSVDGRAGTRYMADGLIFATPTGSTAYSLAAGGPVLMPDSQSVVVTPMTPHALGVRPMVVSEAALFSATPRRRSSDDETARLGVYADGENVSVLEPDETAVIAKCAHGARLVELEGYDPYEVLARKLGWSGSRVR